MVLHTKSELFDATNFNNFEHNNRQIQRVEFQGKTNSFL